MSSANQPLRQSGVYRNLPSFDPSLKGLKAIVCGASGISGFNTIRSLLDTPDRWSTVYALSRSKLSDNLLSLFTKEQASRIKHVSIDLGSSAEDIAKSLRDGDVSADYVFYYAYLPPKSDKNAMDPSQADELVEANVGPFKNFLNSLPLAGLKPKRILLQTGGKNYGVHIGRVRTPVVESDPQPRHLMPNFYYPQEDALKAFCKEHPETCWNVIRPAAIIGTTAHPSMNTFLIFAVYAAVQAQKGQPLDFPSDITTWQAEGCHSSARLTGFLSEWAILEDKCANQDFNAQDGGAMTWDRFFNELARWYGAPGVSPLTTDDAAFKIQTTAGGADAPLGYGPPLTIKSTFSYADWAADKANKAAWQELAKNSNGQLDADVFDGNMQDAPMADFVWANWGSLSMNKARRLGFCGFVDTLESVFEMFADTAKLGLLPEMKVDAARPLM
ncbi:hypothetical protein P153DRAFT_196104 [Dothidotthia symphoricarpi CBS 119687]|uniref:PRISE-like Rossmann-fold domain-containing protein n=1 Tax=Dothidotthia symphoricarpi CBS 119687 TaxID=1392245 RepID=A0A6A6AKN1_9PLEO|nr:uncharacterized protein P153DRAFT_196104 [Dothidotthia symphoricarpi CBS 119687]KAF2131474.1 hypothetical protein P153DRAFT_196104 [Dothidotthia symphoricarpi CBS 119687]